MVASLYQYLYSNLRSNLFTQMNDSDDESSGRHRDDPNDSDQPPLQRVRIDPIIENHNIENDDQDNEDEQNEDEHNEDEHNEDNIEIENFDLPQPILNNSNNRRTIERTEVVGLSTLAQDGAEPQMNKAIVLQLIRLIPHNPYAQNGNAQTYSRPRGYGPVRPSSMPYTRLFMCRVFSENEGNLLVYLMEGTNKNTNLWRNNVELRDNGIITIGTILRITAPLPIDSYMRGDIPLIQTHYPAIVLHSPSFFPEFIPQESLEGESSRAFVLNSATLSCKAFSCEKTKCGGSFCDRQRLTEWNTSTGSCGCYAQRSRGTNNLSMLYPVMKVIHNGNEYVHKNFSSHSFTLGFLNRDFPIGVQANDLQLSEAFWLLGDSIQKTIRFVNRNGGWTVIGWYSRGLINDRMLTGLINNGNSTNSTTNMNNSEVQIDGADMTYHFCRIIPTNEALMKETSQLFRLYELSKFDVDTITSTL
jgi:hypothetical protein